MRIVDAVDWRLETIQDHEIISWLMGGDPAIRWQVMRDFLDEQDHLIEIEREKVAQSGWGARYLSYQEPDGLWG